MQFPQDGFHSTNTRVYGDSLIGTQIHQLRLYCFDSHGLLSRPALYRGNRKPVAVLAAGDVYSTVPAAVVPLCQVVLAWFGPLRRSRRPRRDDKILLREAVGRLAKNAGVILHAVKNGTFHRNPKRKRGQKFRPSLTLRVIIRVNRVQYHKIVKQSFWKVRYEAPASLRDYEAVLTGSRSSSTRG